MSGDDLPEPVKAIFDAQRDKRRRQAIEERNRRRALQATSLHNYFTQMTTEDGFVSKCLDWTLVLADDHWNEPWVLTTGRNAFLARLMHRKKQDDWYIHVCGTDDDDMSRHYPSEEMAREDWELLLVEELTTNHDALASMGFERF